MSTQIRGNKQIKNITIENDQIIDSTIELNKLKEGAELFKRDGSVAATDNLNLDGNQIKNIGTPVDDNDAIRKVDLDELAARVGGTLINRELVAGTKDGENVSFTLANEPTLATEQIFLNGLLLNAGANSDYSIIGNVITFTIPPQATDTILANYVVEGVQLNVDVQATLAAFNSRLTTAEGELFDTEQAVVELGNDATILAGRVTGAEGDISSVKVRATNIENNIDTVEANLAAEQSRAEGAESGLSGRATSSENEIVSVKSRMTTAEGDIDSLEAADGAMDSRVGNLEDGLQAETTARINAVNSLGTRVTSLETADTDVDSRLDVLESDVAGLETDLAAEAATRLANDNTLQSNINAEIANRTSAVSAVQANLNTEIGDRFAADMAEEAARIAADADLQDAIDAEGTRAETAEGLLSGKVDEIEAVNLPEIFGRLDVVESNTDQNTIDIGAEMTRAMAAESGLSVRIDTLETDPVSQAYVDQKISELVNSAPEVLNTLKELSDALGGDENFAASISGQIGAVAADISTEETRAMNAESALDVRVDALEADPVTKTYVDAVDARVNGLVSDLAQEAIDRAANVDAEETRAMNAESALDIRVDALEADPVTKTYVDVEVSSLDSRVDALESAPPPVFTLDGLEDVSVTSPANGEVILYNGSEWVNAPAPSTFSGSYTDLTDKPAIPTLTEVEGDISFLESRVTSVESVKLDKSAYDAKIALVDAKDAQQDSRLTSVEGDISDLEGRATNIEADVALKADASSLATVATSGSYTDLSDKPSLFSGSYNDLSDKPSIPSISGLASELYVDTKVADLVASAPEVLNTLNELASALGDDANFATTVAGQIGDVASDVSTLDTRVTVTEGDITALQTDVATKADIASLALVATSGAYADLSDKPSLFSGSYIDLSDKPSLFSGSYVDLTNKPTIPSALDDLTDVDVSLPGKGQFIVHNGTSFVNSNTIEASGSAVKPLIVKGAASQSANLFEAQRNDGTVVASISAGAVGTFNGGVRLKAGGIYDTSSFGAPFAITGTGSLDGNNYTHSFYGSTNQSTLLVGSTGIYPALVCANGVNEIFRTSQYGTSISPRTFETWGVALTVNNNHAGPTTIANFQSNSVTKVSFSKEGNITASGAGTFNAPAAASKGLIVKGAASQTANLFEAQNSSGVALFSIDKDGSVAAGTVPVARVSGLATVATSGSYDDLSNKPSLFSGSYADLTNKPAIPTPVREVPSGLVDGSNATFVLSQTPSIANVEQVFLNGLLQFAGASDDYTISGGTITFNTAPDTGWKLVVYYSV